jgi:hypothetical protein
LAYLARMGYQDSERVQVQEDLAARVSVELDAPPAVFTGREVGRDDVRIPLQSTSAELGAADAA